MNSLNKKTVVKALAADYTENLFFRMLFAVQLYFWWLHDI